MKCDWFSKGGSSVNKEKPHSVVVSIQQIHQHLKY